MNSGVAGGHKHSVYSGIELLGVKEQNQLGDLGLCLASQCTINTTPFIHRVPVWMSYSVWAATTKFHKLGSL